MLRRSIRLLHPAELLFCSYKIKPTLKTARVLYSTYDKDLPNPMFPTSTSKMYSPDTDILMDQIRKTKTVDRLLELISMHIDVMNTKHIIESMQTIHNMSKSTNFENEILMENETFQNLCSRLMKTIRLLGPQELITVFKVLSTLGIRNNTYVMQSILKMMGSQLNNMSLGQLIFLHFLLTKQKPNSLVDGLKLALPLVLQVQIEQQLDSDNLDEVVNCLQLACKSRLKPAIIERVLAAVVKKAKLLSVSNAVSVVFALLNLETPVDGYKELMSYCMTTISKDTASLNQKQTLTILRLCRKQGYYNSPFLFAVADKIVAEKWNLETTYEVVSHFYKLNFAPQYFVNYFSDVMCTESDTLQTKLALSPLNCLEYLSLTGHHPPRIEEVLKILCSLDKKVIDMCEKSSNLFIKFMGCAAMYGYFPEKYMEKVLDSEYLFSAWSSSKKHGRTRDFEISVSSLVWSLETYDQSAVYRFPIAVLEKLVSSVAQRYEDYKSPIESLIQHGLGGPQFLQTGLYTHDGIFLDHVLAMRSGNYPVALQATDSNESHPMISSSIKFVEDILLPEDAKIVAVVVAPEDKHCRDPEVLKGWVDLQIKCLMKKKYYPVVINYMTFKNMPDREKIPFLMREIKQAADGQNTAYSQI